MLIGSFIWKEVNANYYVLNYLIFVNKRIHNKIWDNFI